MSIKQYTPEYKPGILGLPSFSLTAKQFIDWWRLNFLIFGLKPTNKIFIICSMRHVCSLYSPQVCLTRLAVGIVCPVSHGKQSHFSWLLWQHCPKWFVSNTRAPNVNAVQSQMNNNGEHGAGSLFLLRLCNNEPTVSLWLMTARQRAAEAKEIPPARALAYILRAIRQPLLLTTCENGAIGVGVASELESVPAGNCTCRPLQPSRWC